MSATRPATELSIGIMASSASPLATAANASSKVAQGSASRSRVGLAAGEMRVGAGLALEGDLAAVGFWPWVSRVEGSASGLQELPRPRKVGRSIDTERNGVNERDADAHAGLERAQLLQPLAPLERRSAAGPRSAPARAPIGVDADMVPERALAVRARWRG